MPKKVAHSINTLVQTCCNYQLNAQLLYSIIYILYISIHFMVVMHQPWLVLTFGPNVVKPLGITVKKAVEKKRRNRKIKQYVLWLSDDV
jgi:hypothetical protein